MFNILVVFICYTRTQNAAYIMFVLFYIQLFSLQVCD